MSICRVDSNTTRARKRMRPHHVIIGKTIYACTHIVFNFTYTVFFLNSTGVDLNSTGVGRLALAVNLLFNIEYQINSERIKLQITAYIHNLSPPRTHSRLQLNQAVER